MARTAILLHLLVLLVACATAKAKPPTNMDPSTTMWYEGETKEWSDALPVGNGRLGAMYFGGVDEDRLQFNEDTYWTGGPYDSVSEGAYQHLEELRRLLFDNRTREAHLLFGRHFMAYPVEQMKYQSMGNVVFDHGNQGEVTDYRRELDLRTGITNSHLSCRSPKKGAAMANRRCRGSAG